MSIEGRKSVGGVITSLHIIIYTLLTLNTMKTNIYQVCGLLFIGFLYIVTKDTQTTVTGAVIVAVLLAVTKKG